jgi:hypothetical protein
MRRHDNMRHGLFHYWTEKFSEQKSNLTFKGIENYGYDCQYLRTDENEMERNDCRFGLRSKKLIN